MNDLMTRDTMTPNHRYPLEFSIPAWRSFIDGIPGMTFSKSEGRPGFCIDLLNGYSLSVQFGWGNYCGNKNNPILQARMFSGQKHDYEDVICRDAETAVIFRGELIDYEGDQVQGWRSSQGVIDLLVDLSQRTVEPQKYLEAKDTVDTTVYEAEIVD